MKLTAYDVLADLAAALDVELGENTTLGDARLELLAAIDRMASEAQCNKKAFHQAKKLAKRSRAHSRLLRRIDMQTSF